jgi:hypothetical protein
MRISESSHTGKSMILVPFRTRNARRTCRTVSARFGFGARGSGPVHVPARYVIREASASADRRRGFALRPASREGLRNESVRAEPTAAFTAVSATVLQMRDAVASRARRAVARTGSRPADLRVSVLRRDRRDHDEVQVGQRVLSRNPHFLRFIRITSVERAAFSYRLGKKARRGLIFVNAVAIVERCSGCEEAGDDDSEHARIRHGMHGLGRGGREPERPADHR